MEVIEREEKNPQRWFTPEARAGGSSSSDESDDLFGKSSEIEAHDGPVLIGVRSIKSIPDELRKGLVVVKAGRSR